MKKIILLFSLFATLCAQSGFCVTEAEFKAQQDSLSVLYGKYFGSLVKLMSKENPKLNIEEFKKGLNTVALADTSNVGYMTGITCGTQLYNEAAKLKLQSNINLNQDLLMAALDKALNDTTINNAKMGQIYSDMRVQDNRTGEMAVAFSPMCKKNKADGAEYIAKKLAANEGYVKTASGLVYKVVKKGNGKNFTENDNVQLKYKGTHVNGTVFDSNDSICFSPGSVVPGFKEAMLMMSPGSKMIVIMPSDIAYGDRGAGKNRSGKYTIEPGETLTFEMETFGVKADDAKTEAKADAKTETPAGKSTIKAKGGKPAKPATNQKGKKK